MIEVAAEPFAFRFDPASAALVVIDMQRDFLEPGGFGETLGNDLSAGRRDRADGRRADRDCFARKAGRSCIPARATAPISPTARPPSALRGVPSLRIGDAGPMGRILVRGEPGAAIVADCAPARRARSSSTSPARACSTRPTSPVLNARGIAQLVFAGVTTEVCVQTSMREANDRGYECLLIEDATASYFPAFKPATLAMIRAQGAIVGWTTPFAAFGERSHDGRALRRRRVVDAMAPPLNDLR